MPAAELGRTRTCPHCKTTILERADVCPACRHHLRFGADKGAEEKVQPLFTVDGTVRAPAGADAQEYDVVVVVHDENGAEVARKLVNVGVLRGSAARRIVVQVNGYPAQQKAVPESPAPRLATSFRRRP